MARQGVDMAFYHIDDIGIGAMYIALWSFYILSPGIARAEALALQGTSGSRGLK